MSKVLIIEGIDKESVFSSDLMKEIVFHLGDCSARWTKKEEKTLTREQAIKRIKELSNFKNMDHLEAYSYDKLGASDAITDELIHIFDIKEEELK